MKVQEIINRIKSIQSELPSKSKEFLNDDKKIILDYVRIDQLFELGVDADGNKLEPYTPFTRSVKISEGKNPNVVTLFDEGDYYKGFDFNLVSEDVLNIFSTDVKAPKLIDKYGQRIDDLSEENEQKVNYDLGQKLVTWVLESVKI